MSRPFSFPSFLLETAVDTYFEYLRTYSQELGWRIVEMYPPVQGPNDPIARQVATLLRKPLPAQALTITGLAKHLKTARSVRIVGECGTGKTLMSIGVAHTHADGTPYSTIAMCPPHLVLKWAREVLITVPKARAFIIYDLRNGGDPTRPHGVVEVQLRKGQPVNKGLKTSLFEMRAMGRKGWRKLCPGSRVFHCLARDGQTQLPLEAHLQRGEVRAGQRRCCQSGYRSDDRLIRWRVSHPSGF
jgi:hypothetical protein